MMLTLKNTCTNSLRIININIDSLPTLTKFKIYFKILN